MSVINAAVGSRLYTSRGAIKAENIQVDDLLVADTRFALNPDSEPSHAIVTSSQSSLVGFFHDNLNTRTAIAITTDKGYRTTLHQDQYIVTPRGVKQAKELTLDDCAYLTSSMAMGYTEEDAYIMSTDVEGGASLLDRQFNMGRVLGWLIGDGTIKKSTRQTQYLLYFCHTDIPLAYKFAELFGGVSVGIQTNNGSPTGTKTATVNIPVALMPKRYTTKEDIDADMFTMPVETVRGYLRGLFSADGSVAQYSISLNQSNLPRLETVQKLLMHFGIVSSISLRSEAGTYNWVKNGEVVATGPKKANYTLVISGWSCNQFMAEIGFDVDSKADKLETQVANRSTRAYKAETYCDGICEIEVLENHEFNMIEVSKPNEAEYSSIFAYSSDGILCVAK